MYILRVSFVADVCKYNRSKNITNRNVLSIHVYAQYARITYQIASKHMTLKFVCQSKFHEQATDYLSERIGLQGLQEPVIEYNNKQFTFCTNI